MLFVLSFAIVLILGTMPAEVTTVSAATPTVIRIDNPNPDAEAWFGRSVEGLGDINGDGIGDLAVGAPLVDRVYLLSGADQSVIHTVEDPDGLSGYLFGWAVRRIGDVDGDSTEDLIVGAPDLWGSGGGFPVPDVNCLIDHSQCPDETPQFGRAFLFSAATGSLIRRLIPEDGDYNKYGASVAPLGDVNGDGVPDVAVGAPFLFINLGRVFALSGSDGSQLWKTVEPAEPQAMIASFGYYINEIDDVTGDGRRDLLVAAPYHNFDSDGGVLVSGSGYVLSGSDGTIFRTHSNPAPADNAFFSVGPSSIGDQDWDGIADYAFGEAKLGTLHLYRGSTGELTADIYSPGDSNSDYFGFKVARVDDKNGDGLDDFWVSAPRWGTVYLMNSFGRVLLQVDDPNPDVTGAEGGFGWSISATEDLDGDGGLDLIVGKSVESAGGFEQAGAAFLVLGVSATRVIEVNPLSMSFLTLEGGQPSKTVTVSSCGMAPLTVNYSMLAGSDASEFSKTDNFPVTIQPGDSETITVTFQPSAAGTYDATLSIGSNDPENPGISIPLSGTCVTMPSPDLTIIAPPGWKSFGEVVVGEVSDPVTIIIKNTGSISLNINEIFLTDTSNFILALTGPPCFPFPCDYCGPLPFTLTPGESCEVLVAFSPMSAGDFEAVLNARAIIPAAGSRIILKGRGLVAPEPDIAVFPQSYDFGWVLVGDSSPPLLVTIVNDGDANLGVFGLVPPDSVNFTTDPNSGPAPLGTEKPAIIPPGKSRTVTVTFHPQSQNAFSDTLVIKSDDPQTPGTAVSLVGVGYAYNICDFDKDGDVDFADFAIIADQWLSKPGTPPADIAPEPLDNFIDMQDLGVCAENWLERILPPHETSKHHSLGMNTIPIEAD